MIDVSWLELNSDDVPAAHDWLSPWETNHLHCLRFPKRRADWLLGRWTAKNAVALRFGIPAKPDRLREIEIRPASSGAPQVFWHGALAPVSISISHRSDVGACALAPPGAALGCDLETIEPRGDAFPADYFTAEEQTLLAQAPTQEASLRTLTLLWSAKESALKALGEGLRIDTRRVVVSFSEAQRNEPELAAKSTVGAPEFRLRAEWKPVQVRYTDQRLFQGWWSQNGPLLRTLLALPAPHPPAFLALKAERQALIVPMAESRSIRF